MIAEVARLLKGNEIAFGLYITNSVQEEVGLRGAQMITERIKQMWLLLLMYVMIPKHQ